MFSPLTLALASGIVVSLIAFVGLFTMPLQEARLKELAFLLIALATGALFGDVVIHLLPSIFQSSMPRLQASLWVLAGILSSFVFEKFLRWKQDHGLNTHGSVKPVGRLIVVSDGLHNFVDGVLIGASYLASRQVGYATTLAVILHELPHEIGDFGVLVHAGYSRTRALFFNFLSACVAILGVVGAFIFQRQINDFIPIALAITAGSFLYIAGTSLTPELHKENAPLKSLLQFAAILAGIGIMLLLLLSE